MAIASCNSVVDARSIGIVRLLRVTTAVRSAAAQVPRNAHRRKYDPICTLHRCIGSVSYITGFLSMCKQTLMATARFAYPRRQALKRD